MRRFVTVSAFALALGVTMPAESAPTGAAEADATAPTSEADASNGATTQGEPTIALVKGAPMDKADWKQKKAARSAYRAGMKAFAAKKYDEALALFVKSYGAVASPNSHLMVVRTMLAKEQFLAAYGQAQVVALEAQEAALASARYKTTEQGAKQLVSEIEAKLSQVTVTVNVPETDKGASVTINGRAQERSQWGQPVRVLPGPVEVVLVSATGEAKKTVVAAAGEQHNVEIAPPAPQKKASPVVAEETSSFSFKWPGPDRKKIAYISGGVGAAGLLTFGIFGALSAGQSGRLEEGCTDPAHCNPELEEFADRGRAYQAVANTGLVLGIIGISSGAGFYLWDHFDDGADSVQSPYRPRFSVGPGSLTVSGSF